MNSITTIEEVLRVRYLPILSEDVGTRITMRPWSSDGLHSGWSFWAGDHGAYLRLNRFAMTDVGAFAEWLDDRMREVRDELKTLRCTSDFRPVESVLRADWGAKE